NDDDELPLNGSVSEVHRLFLGRGDNLGKSEQFGADREVGSVGGFVVDTKPDFGSFRHKLDHASIGGKAVALSHREDAAVLQPAQNLVQPVALRVADEQNMTLLDLLHAAVVFNAEGPVTRLIIAQHFAQKAF